MQLHFISLFITTSKYSYFFFNCSITTSITSFSIVCDEIHHTNPMMVHGRINFLWLLLLLQRCYFNWSINGTIAVFMSDEFLFYCIFSWARSNCDKTIEKKSKYFGVVINNEKKMQLHTFSLILSLIWPIVIVSDMFEIISFLFQYTIIAIFQYFVFRVFKFNLSIAWKRDMLSSICKYFPWFFFESIFYIIIIWITI